MGKDKKKAKREKITYVDDGRTLSDMSNTSGGFLHSGKKKKDTPPRQLKTGQTPWQTYRESVKMMFVPMLVVLGCICLLFLIMYLLMQCGG